MKCDKVPGDQVICILDGWDIENNEIAPVKGQVYTVRSVECHSDIEIGLTFNEIINPIASYKNEIGECIFNHEGFKKVKKTNIGVFHDILKNIMQPIKETSHQ